MYALCRICVKLLFQRIHTVHSYILEIECVVFSFGTTQISYIDYRYISSSQKRFEMHILLLNIEHICMLKQKKVWNVGNGRPIKKLNLVQKNGTLSKKKDGTLFFLFNTSPSWFVWFTTLQIYWLSIIRWHFDHQTERMRTITDFMDRADLNPLDSIFSNKFTNFAMLKPKRCGKSE